MTATKLKLNKTNVLKALGGWASSGGKEISQAEAVDKCLAILQGTSEDSSARFEPVGGTFEVSRKTQVISRLLRCGNRYETEWDIFDFSE